VIVAFYRHVSILFCIGTLNSKIAI